jgi:hypothetical protein
MKTILLKLKAEKDVPIDWLLNDINTEYESLLIANELKLPTDEEIDNLGNGKFNKPHLDRFDCGAKWLKYIIENL